jgi:5-formyltetrahydrofolate cyclo-ligase
MKPLDWQGAELAELGKRAREQLRARARATRAALTPSVVAARSRAIKDRLSALAAVRGAKSVALFWPRAAQREVDLREFDAELAGRGVARFYPFMDPNGRGGFATGFRRIASTTELAPRGRGFAEPPAQAPIAARGDIDLVIVPALAVTPEGHRLGYGSGFYDVTLPDVSPPALSIVVAYSFQLLAELPLEAHDVACDAVVTDRELFDPRARIGTTSDPSRR